ncbi:MAG: NAD(P)/FAD-dependent oxidoreductase, partial [Spirochaetales bacterium]|nr:NAD(P)/FAD-dependent oxidoreductase [Spirochaetales bacterium]
FDLIIIGGGVVGCAIAREASKYRLKILLIEKEPDVAEGISKANSGVLHAGFNVLPDSLKARFNVEGLNICPTLAEELDVEYRITKKLVVGKSDSDLPYLENLLTRGKSNGCSGLSIIGEQQIRRLEPQARGKWALLSETTGIISPFQFTIALAENAAENGVEFMLNTAVTGINTLTGSSFRLTTAGSDGGTSTLDCRFLVNSAGMNAASVKSMVEPHDTRVYPCRGEYYITDKEDGKLLGMPVYPVPPADGSGLGVHLTPTCNGNILIGPSADYLEDEEDLANTAGVMAQLKKEAFELMPELEGHAFIRSYSGMRPKLFTKESGTGFADFIIEESDNFPGMINLMGIESPGLTSAPAIAKYVVEELLCPKTELIPKLSYNPRRKGIKRSSHLTEAERRALAAKDPDYAEIICRCEQVSRAEILQAIHNPLGALSLGAIKKRTYSMMGRCQSGFCLPRIIEIICEETGCSPASILQTGKGSGVLTGSLD